MTLKSYVYREIKHEEPQRIHTIHHHHIQKYTVIKKIEVPEIKEVKVPYKVYVYEKVPYKYYVKPLIVKVPIEYYHTKSEKHEEPEQHHEEEQHHEIEQHHEDHHQWTEKEIVSHQISLKPNWFRRTDYY